MISLEQACSDTKYAADEAKNSAVKVVSQARALAKVAQTGNIAAIKRTKKKLRDSLIDLEQKISTVDQWPFSEEEELDLFTHQLVDEIKAIAEDKNLKIYEVDGVLISYPSMVRILPAEKAVQVNRKKISTVRPSHLVELLLANQNKKSGFKSTQFIESLYSVYSAIVEQGFNELIPAESGRVVLLAKIYKLMTALPGTSRQYDRSDFARDLYRLDSDGPHETRKGKRVSFPSSTGARRRSSDLFSFIGPSGKTVDYYGIRFR